MIIHETSIVHPSSKIDDSVEIGPFCIVGENVEIKKGTKLLSHVVIKGPTSIDFMDSELPLYGAVGSSVP